MNKFGISETDFKSILIILQSYGVRKAALFGSRAKGNFSPGSDIDIAIFDEFSHHQYLDLKDQLDKIGLVQRIDLIKVTEKTDQEIVDHIDRVGVLIVDDRSSDQIISKQIQVFGKVQGVFFRASTKEFADKLGLKGWVRNELDGSVLIAVSGRIKDVEKLETWCHKGPMMAQVNKVDVQSLASSEDFSDFSITAS